VSASIEILGHDDQVLGAVTDASATGLAMRTHRPPLVGEEVCVRISLREAVYKVTAVVERVEHLQGDSYVVGMSYDLVQAEVLPRLCREWLELDLDMDLDFD
jgi:hypothetical protein